MRYILLVAMLLSALLLAAPDANAQPTVIYPDSSRSFAFNLGFGLNAFLFWDLAGDADIFIHPANASGNFFPIQLDALTPGLAYWLDFIGFSGPFMVFNVFVTTGGPFFFTGQILL